MSLILDVRDPDVVACQRHAKIDPLAQLKVDPRRTAGFHRVPGPRAMVPLLIYLREVGVVAECEPSVTPLGALVAQYRTWLLGERGLAPSTVLRYKNTARRFQTEQAMVDGVFIPTGLTGADITALLLRECARSRPGRPRGGWPSCARCCDSSTCKRSRRYGWARRFLRSADGVSPRCRRRR